MGTRVKTPPTHMCIEITETQQVLLWNYQTGCQLFSFQNEEDLLWNTSTHISTSLLAVSFSVYELTFLPGDECRAAAGLLTGVCT